MQTIKLDNGVTIEFSETDKQGGRVIITTNDNLTSEVRFNNKGNTTKTYLERDNIHSLTSQKVTICDYIGKI